MGSQRPSEALTSFLSRKPGQDSKRAKKLDPGSCCCYDNAAFPFEISAHPVDHSIFGVTAYILRGETTIAYTGDFRLHGKNGDATCDFVSKAKDASVLITEGTRAGPTEGEKTSEQSVCEAYGEGVEASSGLVIADFSPRNFERLESFQEIAQKTGSELVATAKDIYLLHSLQFISGSSMSDGLRIYNEVMDKSKRKWEQEVVQPNYGDRYVGHKEIRENPDNYILCFSFFDMKHLLDIEPEGGSYIYSSCEAFNEEMAIDFKRLWHWLDSFNINSCGFSLDKDGVPFFEKCYHGSGHASGEDITWAIDQIDPDYIVPIHNEARDWFGERFDNVALVNEGKQYEF